MPPQCITTPPPIASTSAVTLNSPTFEFMYEDPAHALDASSDDDGDASELRGSTWEADDDEVDKLWADEETFPAVYDYLYMLFLYIIRGYCYSVQFK